VVVPHFIGDSLSILQYTYDTAKFEIITLKMQWTYCHIWAIIGS